MGRDSFFGGIHGKALALTIAVWMVKKALAFFSNLSKKQETEISFEVRHTVIANVSLSFSAVVGLCNNFFSPQRPLRRKSRALSLF